MTHAEAARFAQFIHDHDKRFTASVSGDGPDGAVLLRRAEDGTEAATVTDTARYEADFLDAQDPGPTVRAAWARWREAAGENKAAP